MKKLLLVCCFLIGFTAISHAQGGGRMTPEARLKVMQDSLKLTPDQSTQVMAIYKASAAQVDSVRNAGGDRDAMRSIMTSANDKILAILTDDQKAAYKKMQANRRAKMQQNGGGGGGGN